MITFLKPLLSGVAPLLFVVLAFLFGWGGGYFIAHRDASTQCEVTSLKAELAEFERQLGIATEVNDAAAIRAENDEHEIITLEGQLKEYEETIHDKTACTLDADDTRRLRAIR